MYQVYIPDTKQKACVLGLYHFYESENLCTKPICPMKPIALVQTE